MKKLIFTLMVLAATVSMNAQIVKVMKGETVVAAYTADNADKVAFENETDLGKSGSAMRTGKFKVNWVQLWEGGPRFAEYNVGATSATEFGGYYTWGGIHKNEVGIAGVDDHNATIDGTSILKGIEDTATQLWGDNWRMPTSDELLALVDKCDKEETVKNGVYGYKFTGMGDYASNSIFLPAAGSFIHDDVYSQGQVGCYWSSTPNSDDTRHAQCLRFYPDGQKVTHDGREYGFSVRAVLAE